MSWSVHDVSVTFGDTAALSGVSLGIAPGALQSVIGGDGAGKSTLLKVLARLDIGQTGTAVLPPAKRISYVPADGGVFGDLTIDENIEFVARAYRLRNWSGAARTLLERADLPHFGDRLAGHLSGGQRRKLAGCMALLPEPELLILDEVTTGVDPVSRLELWRLMTAAAADGAAVVAATTYLDEAERTSAVTLLHEGRVLAAGTPASIIASVPGAVEERDTPADAAIAWRKGRRWRQWEPESRGGRVLTLEDAAIIFELMANEVSA